MSEEGFMRMEFGKSVCAMGFYRPIEETDQEDGCIKKGEYSNIYLIIVEGDVVNQNIHKCVTSHDW